MKNTIFIGDDINDFKAMKIAGKKIYYCGESRGLNDWQLPNGVTMIHKNNLLEVANKILTNFEDNEYI